jgi:GAF domain-containing protein
MERGNRTIMDIPEHRHIDSEREHIEHLYRFTDRLWRAENPNQLYQAALEAIACTLACSRASILLLDEAGRMHFASQRGISDKYRATVECRSPWTRDVKDPQPVCIQDIEEADLTETVKNALRAEQIGALAFIPIIANGALIGEFVAYYDARHVFSDTDVALAVITARQLGLSLEKRRVEDSLCMTQRQLEAELAAAEQLQKISTQLIHTSDVEMLYEKILDAAVAIMHSDFASMQMFYPERGELRLLAYRGFNAASAAFWEWVRPASASTCGIALATGRRSIVADVELSHFMAGSEDLQAYRQNGIRAVQSTPLVSRAGHLSGIPTPSIGT